MRVVLDKDDCRRGLRRMAGEIIERHQGPKDLLLIGIRRGGVPLARELQEWIKKLEGVEPPMGTVDITLYRDDAATALPNPRIGPSEIPGSIDRKRIVLVDDVAFTGRTVRAALDALMDYGRPRTIELAVLVDRSGRELPIQPDYSVRRIDVGPDERIDVVSDESGTRAVISPAGAPSIPPPAT